MYKETILEESNIGVFNKVGEYAEFKNLNVLYFKVKKPILGEGCTTGLDDIKNLELGEVSYIHLYDNKEYDLVLSIYYDTKSINGFMECPYYEVFDGLDVERFFNDEENELFEYAKGIIDKVAVSDV